MLTDAGPLLALLVDKDEWSPACRRFSEAYGKPLITTQIVFGEAMYHMGSRHGYQGQDKLWKMVRTGGLFVLANEQSELTRMDELMLQYKDASRGGMDLGDASLVAAAETLGLKEVFTIDSHFYAYQLADGSHLTIVPGSR